MKKQLILSALMCMGISLFGFETFKDAMDAAGQSMKNKQNVEAAAQYAEARKLAKTDAEKQKALASEANALRITDKYEDAIARYRELLAIPTPNVKTKTGYYSVILTLNGKLAKFDEITKTLDTAFTEINDPVCRNNLCNSAFRAFKDAKQPEKALEMLKKANATAELSPELKAGNFLQIAAVYGGMKNAAEQEAALKNAYELSKNTKLYPEAAVSFARFQVKAKKYDEALPIAQDVFDKLKGKASARFLDAAKILAGIHAEKKQYDEALKIVAGLETLSDWKEHQKKSLENLKLLLLEKAGRLQDVITILENKLKSTTDPDELILLNNAIAAKYFEMKNYVKAQEAIARAETVLGAKKAKPYAALKKRIEKKLAEPAK